MICELHNKIQKTWVIIIGETWCWYPDKKVSLGEFLMDILYVLLFPIFLIVGLLIRIYYRYFPEKLNIFKGITFECERTKDIDNPEEDEPK